MTFLHNTIDDDRVMGIEDWDAMHTWVDASYAIHPDMKGHMGGIMSLWLGIIHTRSSKQKLNTKSSTESEVFGG